MTLHQSGVSPVGAGPPILLNSPVFTVTAGADFALDVLWRMSSTSQGSGYNTVIFLDQAGKEVVRTNLTLEPGWAPLSTAKTDDVGRFFLLLPHRGLNFSDLRLRFDGSDLLRPNEITLQRLRAHQSSPISDLGLPSQRRRGLLSKTHQASIRAIDQHRPNWTPSRSRCSARTGPSHRFHGPDHNDILLDLHRSFTESRRRVSCDFCHNRRRTLFLSEGSRCKCSPLGRHATFCACSQL